MKSRASRSGAALAAAGTALGALAAAAPALAQFPTSIGPTGATRAVRRPGRAPVYVQVKNNYLLLSPYLTTFQFKTTGPSTNGQFITTKTNNTGPFFQLEKHIPLEDTRTQPSSLAVGAWYWYNGSKQRGNADRLALYTQYNVNQNFSAQISLGGATHGTPSGLFEYYGFLLYSPTLPRKSNFGIQLGAGPYIPRRSIGDVGYTYTVGAVYKLTTDYSLSASYWKVNYNKPAGTFGTAVPNDLSRTNLSLVYNFK